MSNSDLQHLDEAARRAAQTVFDRPLVLEAGAGTGKTSALVARLTAWSLGPGWERAASSLEASVPTRHDERVAARVLDRIVAITFTEAAAAEMASRVGEAFLRIESGEIPEGLFEEALPAAAERRRRAHALVATLDHLSVRTIHAYCRRLLAAAPLEAGVHPAFEVDADQSLLDDVLRDVLDDALPRAYGEPGDDDLLQLAGGGFGPVEVQAALRTLIDGGLPPEVLDDDPFAPHNLMPYALALREQLQALVTADGGRCESLRQGRSPLGAEVGTAAADSLQAWVGLERGRDQLATFLERLRTLWTDDVSKRLQEWGEGKFNGAESKVLGTACVAIADAAAVLTPTLKHWLTLDPQRLDHARRALKPLLAAVYGEMHSRGIATFGSLLRGARDLLANHPAIAQRVRGGIDQLLVDEFQDTDAIQCEMIRLLAMSGPVAERPALFIVGDPKQSIYGWRNADLRAYDRFVDELCRSGGDLHRLSINFRSVPVILAEVERVVGPIMQRVEGVQPAFQALEASPQRSAAPLFQRPGSAPIEYWVSWDAPSDKTASGRATEIEAASLANDLANLHAEGAVAWSDVAVLLRSLGDLGTYTNALREAGVPYRVARDRGYYLRREVIDASAAVQCILDPGDHLALLALLRSAVVGVPDAAWMPLWQRGFARRMTELHGVDDAALVALEQLIHAAARATPKVAGIERVRGWEHSLLFAVQQIARLRESFRSDPADLFLEKLRTLLLLEPTEAARHLGVYRLANLERFFQQLLRALETSTGDAHAVLRRLRLSVAERREAEEARPQESGDDAVQIMTIHAAKGLAFPHVYVMQLHKQSRGVSTPRHEVSEATGTWQYRLFAAPTPGFADVQVLRAEREEAEMLRTLYVAMTRARDRLVLAGNWPREKKSNRRAAHVDFLVGRMAEGQLVAWCDAAGDGDFQHVDDTQSLWSFPAAVPSVLDPQHSAAAASIPPVDVSQVAADQELLRLRREEAGLRMQRRFSGAASAEAHHQLLEILSQSFDERTGAGAEGHDVAPGLVARLAGTAVHRALEAFDLQADPELEMAAQQQALDRYVSGPLGVGDRAAVLQHAQAVLQRFCAGPLWERFVALRPQILGREVPVLLPPSRADGPVGFVSGAIDMVYRDPQDGSLVVVDFKTDAVVDPDEVEQRAQGYAPQGGIYTRALQEAFELAAPPRFELWFLHPGVVRCV